MPEVHVHTDAECTAEQRHALMKVIADEVVKILSVRPEAVMVSIIETKPITRLGAEVAQVPAIRAARLQEIVTEIRRSFCDPAFSLKTLSRRLGISGRYLQTLLHETGANFTKRVLELRLQRARQMVLDPRHDGLKVAEIANLCGFNEVPYFNRCFRRRFGASPTQCRDRERA
jgi:AraC-like DNA-binding protein